MHHVCLENGAGYIGNIRVKSLHYINDSGYHQALLNDVGGARLFLFHAILQYSSVATASGLDVAVPFLLQEHQIGHCGPTILSAELLWIVWLQGVHCDPLVYFLLNIADSALTEALHALIHIVQSHGYLQDREELLVHAVL